MRGMERGTTRRGFNGIDSTFKGFRERGKTRDRAMISEM